MGNCFSKSTVVDGHSSNTKAQHTHTNGTAAAAANEDAAFHDSKPSMQRSASFASDIFVDALEEPASSSALSTASSWDAPVSSNPSTTLQDVMRAVAKGQVLSPTMSGASSLQPGKATTLSKVDLVAPSDSDEWLNDLLAMIWPFLRAAAHTEVLRIAAPVLDNMPPFVANVLLPGLGTVVSVPIQGIAAAIKLVDMLGPHPPRLIIRRVYTTPEGHAALDWQCIWRMEGTAALAVTPTMSTSGQARQASMMKGMAGTLKSKALRFHSHLTTGIQGSSVGMDTRGSDTDNNDTNSTTTNEGGHSAFAAPTATPPGDGPTAPVLPIQEEEHEGVEEHEEGVHEEDDGQRKEVDISLTDSQMLTIASAAAQNTMQTRLDAEVEGLSIGEWAAVCPEQEPVRLQGALNAKDVEEDTSPAPSGSILASALIHSDLNFRGTVQVSMQSMADALLSGLEGGLSMHGGSATGAVHKGNGGSGGGGGGKAKLPAGMSALVDLKRFEDKTWFNQLIECLWPQLRALGAPFIHSLAPPLISAVKPYWIADVRLGKVDLGSAPPIISNLRIFEDQHELTPDVMMDMELTWHTENMLAEVLVQLVSTHMKYLPKSVAKALSGLMTFRGGINDFWMTARLRIMMRPLLERLPVLGAVQVAFVDLPTFDMDVTCYGGEMWMLGPIKTFFINMIRDVVLGQYVFPDTLTIPIDQHVRPINPPEGLLELEIVEGVNVPRMDWWPGTHADMFVELWVSKKHKSRTRVITSAAPVYNERFSFPVHVVSQQQCKIICWDVDALGNEEIGRVMFELSEVDSGSYNVWIEVPRGAQGKVNQWTVANIVDEHSKAFRLHLKGKWYRFTPEEVGLISAAQMLGPLRVLSTKAGRELDETISCYLLRGSLQIIVQAARGLGIKHSKRVFCSIKVEDKTSSTVGKYGPRGVAPTAVYDAHDDSIASVTFSHFFEHKLDLTEVSMKECIHLQLKQSNGVKLGSTSLRISDVVDQNVAGWQPLTGGKSTAEIMLFIRWCGFFD